jgi:hypothetical protein
LDEAGCIRLEEQGGQMQWLVWPEGWTAEVTGQEVVITEPSGKHSLRTGEPVELGGVLSDSLDDDRSGILRHGR